MPGASGMGNRLRFYKQFTTKFGKATITKEQQMERRFVRLSEADGLLIKKSTLYKWSAKNKYPELFSQVEGRVFVDTQAIDEFLERNKRKGDE